MTKAATTLALASYSVAQSAENKERYLRFAWAMEEWGYTWEPYKITTDDGYILTTFRITGNKAVEGDQPRDPDLMPVVFKHGYLCDAVTWFGNPNSYVLNPAPLRLFDAGFDVWMASDRGTQYC